MTQALRTMRVDIDPSVRLKTLDTISNQLLEKRKNRTTPTPKSTHPIA